MEPTKGKIFYGWYIVAACTLIMATLFALMMSCMSLFIVPVTESLGISRSEFSLLLTIVAVIGMFLSPIAGGILAKKNMRFVMAGGLAVCSLGYASLSFAQSTLHLYASAVVMGLSFQFCTTVAISMLITRWFVKSRSTAMSITFAGSSLGGVVLSPVLTAMIGGMGWRTTFASLGIGMCVVLTAIALLLIRSSPEDKGLKALGAEQAAAQQSTGAGNAVGLPLAELRKTGTFWIFAVGVFICILSMGSIYHIPAHIVGIGFTPEQAALCLSTYSLVGIFGKLLMGAVFDKGGLKAGILLGVGAMSLTFVLLIVARSMPLLLVTSVLYGIGNALGTVFAPTLTGRIFGTKYYGQTFGLVNSFSALAMAIGNPMMAATYDISGAYTVAWLIGIAAVVTAAILFFIVIPRGKKLMERAG